MIQLTLPNAKIIYVNPKHIVCIEPSEGSSRSKIYFVNRDFYVLESPDEIMYRIYDI
jgi:uncharacterized protein YlzI (FlbEa/FlbD family)